MNRFDLETKISDTFVFVDHIKSLSNSVIAETIDNDKFVNALEGLAVLLEIHATELMDIFTQAFRLDQYNEYNDE